MVKLKLITVLFSSLILLLILFACKKDDEVNCIPGKPVWKSYGNVGDTIRDMANGGQLVWMATQNNGLVSFRKETEQFQYFKKENSNIPTDYTTSVEVNAQGIIWVGTEHHGLLKFDGTTWQTFDTINSMLPTNTVRALRFDDQDVLWIGTLKGMIRMEQEVMELLDSASSGIPNDKVTAIEVHQNEVWVGTQAGGLGVLKNGLWEYFNTSNSGLEDNEIRTIAFDEAGNLWTASFNRCYKYDWQTWEVFKTSNSGLSSAFVNDILPIGDRIWIATHDGLDILNGEEWENLTPQNVDIPHSLSERLLKDENGDLWLGTFGGLARYGVI